MRATSGRRPSVAEFLRERARAEALVRSIDERVALSLALGEMGLEASRRSIDPPLEREEARRRLARKRQAGRRPSACMDALLG